jgi:hypothetical protein
MICNKAHVVDRMIAIILVREELDLVFNNVPARICSPCWESFSDEETTASILNQSEKLAVLGLYKGVSNFTKVK